MAYLWCGLICNRPATGQETPFSRVIAVCEQAGRNFEEKLEYFKGSITLGRSRELELRDSSRCKSIEAWDRRAGVNLMNQARELLFVAS